MSHMIGQATTGVVAIVRPRIASFEAAPAAFPRTQAPVVLATDGTRMSFGTPAATVSLDRTAVITQDPYNPVSGKQLWNHPPV